MAQHSRPGARESRFADPPSPAAASGAKAMRAYMLFQRIPAETAADMVRYLREHERDAYKSTLATLAAQRKLRPVFIQKRPADRQIAWIAESLRLRAANDIGDQVIHIWLMKGHKDMLVAFLDAMHIAHDGEGAVEDLPESLDEEALRRAVEMLVEKFPPQAVAVYLNVFHAQRPDGWPALAAMLANDPQLQLEGGPDKPDKPDKSDKSDASDKSDKSDRSDKSDKSDEPDASDAPDKPDKPDESDAPEAPDEAPAS